jgi:hypothetical protein
MCSVVFMKFPDKLTSSARTGSWCVPINSELSSWFTSTILMSIHQLRWGQEIIRQLPACIVCSRFRLEQNMYRLVRQKTILHGTYSHHGGPGSSPGLVKWDLWWTKWRWGKDSPSTSVSLANLHSTNFSIIIITQGWYNRPFSGRRAEVDPAWAPPPPHYANGTYIMKDRPWPISRYYLKDFSLHRR